jgi:plasmid stabilization system protein ParE
MTTDKRGPGFQDSDEDVELRDTPPTEAEWEALSFYIIEQSRALRAERAVMRIRSVLNTLASMPRMGRPQPYLLSGVLAFSVRPWVIFYEPLQRCPGHHRVPYHRRPPRSCGSF